VLRIVGSTLLRRLSPRERQDPVVQLLPVGNRGHGAARSVSWRLAAQSVSL